MEFLPLSRRRSSARNVPSYEERGETDVFAGYWLWNTYPFVPSSNSEICIRCFCDLASELMSLSICSNTWTTSENIVGHRGVRCWAEMRSIRTLKKGRSARGRLETGVASNFQPGGLVFLEDSTDTDPPHCRMTTASSGAEHAAPFPTKK